MLRTMMAKLIPARLARFSRDERGVSAVEFALLLPVMITIYLGGVEVSQGISIDRKVTLTARTVADLVSQVSSVDVPGVNNVLQASTAVMSPYPVDKAKVTVTVIDIDANKNAKVRWSESLNGAKKSGSVTVPPALLIANTSLVWGEAEYSYKPTIGYVITGTMTLSDQIYMRPRLSETVQCPTC